MTDPNMPPPITPDAPSAPSYAPPAYAPPASTPPTSGPPTAPAPAAPAKRSVLVPVLLAALVALLIGAGIGYAISVPGRSDLTAQRDNAQASAATTKAQLDKATADLAAANTTLEDTKKELATAKAGASGKEACSKAATDANDFIGQIFNILSDYEALAGTPTGSAAEAQLLNHINEQSQKMDAQEQTVKDELSACKTAVS